MKTLGYPRQGERIAPRWFREVLRAPLPAALVAASGGEYTTFAQLNRPVWQHAPKLGHELAKALAEYLQARLRQLPAAILERRLPRVGPGTTFDDLRLGRRTLHCVVRRHAKPRDLAKSTVRDVIRWCDGDAISLLDLLCALEAHAPWGGAPPRLAGKATLAWRWEPGHPALRGLPCRLEVDLAEYPRVRQKIAPALLAPLLGVPIEPRGKSAVQFKDLDESAWDTFDPGRCFRLGQALVEQVRKPDLLLLIGSVCVPVPATGGEPLRLQLGTRAFNCLEALGALEDPTRLARMTFRELLQRPGFGPRCAIDLLSALESRTPAPQAATRDVAAAARSLARTPGAELVGLDDVRFGPEMQCLKVQGKNLRAIAERIAASASCPSPPKTYARLIKRLQRRLERAPGMTLEEELADLLSFEVQTRDREIALARLGWAGEGPRTMEEVSHEHGLTRERVRQLCDPILERLEGKRPYLPVLDRALQAAETAVPCSKGDLEALLLRRHLTKIAFHPGGLLEAAAITSRACPFVLESYGGEPCVLHAGMGGLGNVVGMIARKAMRRRGVATVEGVAAKASAEAGREVSRQFARAALSAQPGFRWLDEAAGWFWLEAPPRNLLLKRIKSMLAARNPIKLSEVQRGLAECHEGKGFVPSERILLELCAQSGWCRAKAGLLHATAPVDDREALAPAEATMVAVLKENRGVLGGKRFRQLCLARGVTQAAYHDHCTSSAAIVQYPSRVFGLRGVPVTPGRIAALAGT